ncbi:MAG TPA: NIL domain-containing protein, partial [Beutenbergiaceae bacterium]|nr:NIL domain-containing protein [Beutenbergiaceae bacterium]
VEIGETYEVFTRPQTPVTEAFVASSLQDRPTPEVLLRLRERHPGRLVTIGVDDAGPSSGQVMHTFTEHGVKATVVYGSITEISGRPSGSLTYELSGGDITKALGALPPQATVVDWGNQG